MLWLTIIFGAMVGLALGLTGGGGALFAVPLLVYGLVDEPSPSTSWPWRPLLWSRTSTVEFILTISAHRTIRRRGVGTKTASIFSSFGVPVAGLRR